MKLKCLIVDDEPPAHKVLENYIGKLNSLTLIGNCYNAIEALNFLHEQSVDLVFLDINMPELSGLEMLKTLNNPPMIILTTAYSEFALEAYEYGVSDYLLKPIRFDRFLKAINRVVKIREEKNPLEYAPKEEVKEELSFFVKADGIQHKVWHRDLEYIESQGNFVQLHLEKSKLLTAETLSNMNSKLNLHGFLRVHKSYIVNIKKVKGIEGNRLLISDTKIPIGKSYKQMVLNKIGMI